MHGRPDWTKLEADVRLVRRMNKVWKSKAQPRASKVVDPVPKKRRGWTLEENEDDGRQGEVN